MHIPEYALIGIQQDMHGHLLILCHDSEILTSEFKRHEFLQPVLYWRSGKMIK